MRLAWLQCLSLTLWGATCTTTGSGPALWTDSVAWTGCSSRIPGAGDTVAIARPITVPVNTSVGLSGPSGVLAVRINSPGSLTVASGATFTLHGDVLQNNASIVLLPGAVWQFDSTLAASPATTKYAVRIANHYQTNNMLIAGDPTGADTRRVTIRSVAGGGNGYWTLNGFLGYGARLYRTDFLRVGDAANRALAHSLYNSAHRTFILSDVTFDTTGGLGGFGPVANVDGLTWSARKVRFTRTLAASCMHVGSLGDGTGKGNVRELENVVFDKLPFSISPGSTLFDFTLRYIVQFAADGSLPLRGVKLAEYFAVHGWKVGYGGGVIRDSFVYAENPSVKFNPQALIPHNGGGLTTEIDGLIFQASADSTDGDMIIVPRLSTGQTLTVRRTIILPKSGGTWGSSGTLLVTTERDPPTVRAFHNTYTLDTGDNHGFQFNETGAQPAGTLAEWRSNIGWAPTLMTGNNHFNQLKAAGLVDNVADPAGVTNNCAWNADRTGKPGKSSDNTYYDMPMTGTIPGAGDVNVDPRFVDPTRNLETWAKARFSTDGSVSAAMSALAVDPVTRIPDLLGWIRAGFVPQNPALWTSGHAGAHIGAASPATLRLAAGAAAGPQ